MSQGGAFIEQIVERAASMRTLRDEHGWPEPRTIAELRTDPRYLLRNSLRGDPGDENLVVAGALLLLVAETLVPLTSEGTRQ